MSLLVTWQVETIQTHTTGTGSSHKMPSLFDLTFCSRRGKSWHKLQI